MSEAGKPLPVVTECNQPYWTGAREGVFKAQRCIACSHLRFPPARICDACLGESAEWVSLSGQGTVWSICEFHRPYLKGFAAELPYNVAVVALFEGPRLYTNIVGRPYAEITVGMRVEAVFDTVAPDISLVKFRPVPEESL